MVTIYELRGRREGQQDNLLMLLRAKFGEFPEEWPKRVTGLTDEAELQRLVRRVDGELLGGEGVFRGGDTALVEEESADGFP